MPIRRCQRCRRYHRRGEPCPLAPAPNPRYQTPGWRRARKAIEGLPCEVPDCRTPWHRVAAHHLIPDGPDESWNFLRMCGHDHSRYEAQNRAGRDTPLTRFVAARRRDAEAVRRTLGGG